MATDLSAAESAVYDRQIRLWGRNAQARLSRSSVLVRGLGPLGAEVAKNLILAGVGRVLVEDPTVVTPEALATSYLLSPGDHRSVQSAAIFRLARLNPLVRVEELSSSSSSSSSQLDVVVDCGTLWPGVADAPPARSRIRACAHGLRGWAFFDLGPSHSYEVAAPRKDRDGNVVVGEEDVKTFTASFEPLQASLAAEWSWLRPRQASDAFFAAMALESYHLGSPGTRPPADLAGGLSDLAKSHKLPFAVPASASQATQESAQYWGVELAPVVGVVAGFTAQEVIKAITGRDEPVNNWFFFDGLAGPGHVLCLPKPQPAPPTQGTKRPREQDDQDEEVL